MPDKDFWTENGMTFVCDGIGYCVTPKGGTACIGPVDKAGKAVTDVFAEPRETPQNQRESPSKRKHVKSYRR